MKKFYVVNAFKVNYTTDSLKNAIAVFDAIKHNYGYVELKEVTICDGYYHSQSLQIAYK